MSPIYLAPSFCGKNAKLQLKKDLLCDDLFLPKDTTCIVKDIVGYAYIIATINSNCQETFRIKDGIMEEYFYILDPGVKPWIEEDTRKIKSKNLSTVSLIKDLSIKNVITLKAGTEFFPVEEVTNNGKIYWDLYDVKTYERTLRLSDDEFKMYFKA